MAQLPNKNIEPAVAVLLNLIPSGIVGFLVIGQERKAIFVLVVGLLGTLMLCVPGIIVMILGMIDIYQVADAVRRGEYVDENEYRVELLYQVCKVFHQEAIYRGPPQQY